MIEIMLYGRGGQGVVTAGELLVKAAIHKGIYGQSIPFFGGERRGAPVYSYVRIDNKPVRIHRQTYTPDILAVFDTSLIASSNVAEKLKKDGIAVLNTDTPKQIGATTYYIDATKIAKDINLVIAGWPIVNTALTGAMSKVLDMFSFDALKDAINETFEGSIKELNLKAAQLGFEGVKKLD